jgi:hypothetical protein
MTQVLWGLGHAHAHERKPGHNMGEQHHGGLAPSGTGHLDALECMRGVASVHAQEEGVAAKHVACTKRKELDAGASRVTWRQELTMIHSTVTRPTVT